MPRKLWVVELIFVLDFGLGKAKGYASEIMRGFKKKTILLACLIYVYNLSVTGGFKFYYFKSGVDTQWIFRLPKKKIYKIC